MDGLTIPTAPNPMQPGLDPGMVPPQLPRLMPRRIPAPPPEPSDDFLESAKEFVLPWLKWSLEEVKSRREVWLRAENLFKNKLTLDYWNKTSEELETYLENLTKNYSPNEDEWRSQLCLSTAPLILTYVDKAFQAIFGTEEWFRVMPRPRPNESSVEDGMFSTSEKIQRDMALLLQDARIMPRIYEALTFCGIYEVVYAKVGWAEKVVPVHYQDEIVDANTGEVLDSQPVTEYETVSEHPDIQIIKPDCILPDPDAQTDNIQSWTGIAHRTPVTWYEVKARFDSGTYNVGKDEFFTRWPTAKSVSAYKKDIGEVANADLGTASEDYRTQNKLTAWEYHGEIPTDDRTVESLCTVITEKDSEAPESGIIVRLQEGTPLRIGKRPFVAAQYTQWPGWYGIGASTPHLDLVWVISHLLNLVIDNLRLTINAAYKVTPQFEQLNDKKSMKPGRKFVVLKDVDCVPFTQPAIDYGAILNLITYLAGRLEMDTGVSDAARGASNREKTAREIHFLAEQLSTPVFNRLSIFKQNFLDPLLTLCLAQIQQNTLEGRQVPIRDSEGNDQFEMITADELRSGTYAVSATLGNADTSTLAEAQTLKDLLPTLAQMKQLLEMEGTNVSLTTVVKAIVHKLRVELADKILQPMSPEQVQAMQAQQMAALNPPNQAAPGGPGPEVAPSPGSGPAPGPDANMDQIAMLLQQLGADEEGRTQQQ